MSLAKTITEFVLRKFYMETIQENAVLIFPALDIFETLLTIYTLYCMFLLCSCLQQGLIYEYQPVVKFSLISLMAIVVVC